jgi:hypothetical protein
MVAEVQLALFALSVGIAFATPTGRRNTGCTMLLFGGAALGGFLGFVACYATELGLVLAAFAGLSILKRLGDNWLIFGFLSLGYVLGTLYGARAGWQLAKRNGGATPRLRGQASPIGEVQ